MTVKDATVPTPPALLIAAHGTRLPAGQDAARALTALVASKLPDVVVKDAFIELTDPPLDATVAELAASGPLVVVPLMLGAGGHLRDDIPEAIDAAPVGARIALADHLGPDPRLRAAVRERIGEVLGDWAPDQTAVVFLGRGCSVPDANPDHTRLGRMLWEEGGYAYVTDAFIQVASPTLAEGLSLAYSTGARKIVVAPHYLFPGLLENWAHDQSARWAAEHPDAEVRVAPIIGAGDALADVVIDRYRAAAAHLDEGEGSPVYLSGLDLRARRVLVAGAGRVATRRISRLLEVDADVTVVAPEASGRVTAWAAAGALTWERRTVEPADVDGAWYVLAATDSAQANAAVAAAAERAGTFCVRVGDAHRRSAWGHWRPSSKRLHPPGRNSSERTPRCARQMRARDKPAPCGGLRPAACSWPMCTLARPPVFAMRASPCPRAPRPTTSPRWMRCSPPPATVSAARPVPTTWR